MDVELWNSTFKSAAIWLGVFTAIATGLGWWTESVLNERNEKRLASAESSISLTTKELADAKTRQAEAETRLKTVEGDTAKQQERAAKAEKELLEVQERLRPRTLTGAARIAFIDALIASPVKGEVLVSCVVGDAEGCAFAKAIHSCLAEAGWPVLSDIGATPQLSGYGLFLRMRDINDPPKHAPHLQKIMQSIGLLAGGESVATMPVDRVFLWVGSKR